jgi:hypothetical protein
VFWTNSAPDDYIADKWREPAGRHEEAGLQAGRNVAYTARRGCRVASFITYCLAIVGPMTVYAFCKKSPPKDSKAQEL